MKQLKQREANNRKLHGNTGIKKAGIYLQGKEQGKTKTIYMACAWFNEEQTKMMNEGYKKLKANPTVDWENSYRPLEHQYAGINVEEHPEWMRRVDWQAMTFKSDISGMAGSDIGVFLYNPKSPDEGSTFECGYLYAINKPIVIVVPDEDYGKVAINLMPAIGATDIIKLSELSTYNFNKVYQTTYKGAIY